MKSNTGWIVVAAWVVCLSASCSSPNKYSPRLPKDYYKYRYAQCNDRLTEQAFAELQEGKGAPEASLYYFRCRKEPEYLQELRRIHSRKWLEERLRGIR